MMGKRYYELSQEGNRSNELLQEADRKHCDSFELLQECDNLKEISKIDLGSLSNSYES